MVNLPAGGSCWRRLKSRISRLRAGVDILTFVLSLKQCVSFTQGMSNFVDVKTLIK